MNEETSMTDYNPIVQVRTTLEPNSPARYMYVETTFNQLYTIRHVIRWCTRTQK
jgi:hypothetical protein